MFDDTTIAGYFGYFAICLALGNLYVFVQICMLSFFSSCCLFLRAYCFDVKTIFDKMDEISGMRNSVENQLELKRLLAKIVEFHIYVKMFACFFFVSDKYPIPDFFFLIGIFLKISQIMSGSVFIQQIIITATTLFEFDAVGKIMKR